MSGFDTNNPFDFMDPGPSPPSTSTTGTTTGTTGSAPLRFDPFADPTPVPPPAPATSILSTSTSTSLSSVPSVSNSISFNSVGNSNMSTPKKKKNPPPSLQVDSKMDGDRDNENFGIFSPAHSKPRTVKINSIGRNDFDAMGQGMVLGRVSMRSLVMRDWTPFFYVVMTNSDIRYYEDPHFLKKNSPEDYSIVIYREKDDYVKNPMGTHIKKVIPLRPNYCCGEVKRKDYGGDYGMLYYFVVQELSEVKNTPVAKFASNNRTDMDLMWMNIKCRVASAKKRQIESLVGL